MFSRFIPLVSALILGGVNLPSAIAQTRVDSGPAGCAFNLEVEKCYIHYFEDTDLGIATYRVEWLADGKVVEYFLSNCWSENDHTMCQTRITEDNGQVSYGIAERGCIGPSIKSENGNSTALRFVPGSH